ncbi:LysR family transcriptional regulator [Ideonella sp. BN130291]|uniref:LysR family transcriptional regulator n=1 Tax=Ideonella sp. BN130291 TaxID=3112940 RepID=UPI002E25C3D1|nr:LysR substrate-binding domain-containing protein [Ideonella sp. BN130291]
MANKDNEASAAPLVAAAPLDVSSIATLPLHALAAFEAAARLGSFARAAQELCITQSGVSHRIRQLEGRLGGPLFERAGKAARLLPLGQRYLAPVADGLARLRLATATIDDTERRLVRVAATAALGTHWLVPHIGQFLQRHPQVRVDIGPMAGPGDAAAGAADVLIEFGEAQANRGNDVAAFPVSLQLVAGAPWAHADGPLAEAQLRAAPLLRHPLFPWARWARAALGIELEPAGLYYFDDTVTMLEAAAGGLGLALAPSIACDAYVARGALQVVHPAPLAGFECRARVSDAGAVKPGARALAQWLGQQLGAAA